MRVAMRLLLLVAIVASAGTSAQAQEKVTLSYKAKVNQVVRYKTEGTLNVEAGGMKMDLQMKETGKVTVTAVAADGAITVEHETESVEMTVGGQSVPAPDSAKEKSTVTIAKNGVLLSYKGSGEAEQTKMAVRMHVASSVIFPDKPVGVGDKWTHDTKADDSLGVRAATSEYEVLGFEKMAGADTVKVKYSFRESEGSPAMAASGTLWVEKDSGDTVAGDMQIDNMAGPQGAMMSGKIHQERIEGSMLGAASGAAATTGTKPDTKPEPKKDKTIDETVKDYEKLPGLLTVYHKRESGRDTYYMEIPEEKLDKLMLIEVTASTGTASSIVAGDPIADVLVKFSKSGDEKILLVTPNIGFRAKDGTPTARSVRRSFADGYLEAFKIEAKQPERKSLLINISDIFRSDIAQIAQRLGGGGVAGLLGGAGGGSYSLDRDKTYVASFKVFPENIVVETAYHFTGSGRVSTTLGAIIGGGASTLADPRSVPLRVCFNIFPLTDNGYKPRLADGRVGYFTTDYQDFDNDSVDDPTVRYILRWQLEKADPKAALSAPKEPIVFWLDNAIPVEYRAAVREGLLYWNKAYEKVGIKDAIVVKQMPDDADWDHADMRYNTIRWVSSPVGGYAVALFRVNPLTGQILNSNITLDAGLAHISKLERRRLVEPSTLFQDAPAPTAQSLDARQCTYAAEAMREAYFGLEALRLAAPAGIAVDEKAYTHAFLRSIVAHEMGHIMGLRHNFVASTYHTAEELKDGKTLPTTSITASVMDYTPFNIFALKTPGADLWATTLGPYDTWAIQYGYTPIDSTTPAGELYKLKQIASHCNEPGHAYQSDEIADQFDPYVVRFDLGKNPLDFCEKTLQTSRYLMLHLPERMPKKGESYGRFTQDFSMLLGSYASAAARAERFIGGVHLNRNFRGDANEIAPVQPASGEDQKRALRLVNDYLFADNAFAFPASYYAKLGADPFPDLVSATIGLAPQDLPIRDSLSSIQQSALRRLFAVATLKRVANNEFRAADPARALTMPTLFHSVSSTVWSELGTGKNIGALRRQLQRTHLDTMIDLCLKPTGAPDDARMLAWDQLVQLQGSIGSARRRSDLDEYTRLHLEESLMRIDRALKAQQTIGAAAPPQQSLLQMLLGNETGK